MNKIEHGEFYVIADYMIIACDYDRVDNYSHMWHKTFNSHNDIEVYCKALEDCGYKNTGEVKLNEE